MTLDECKTTLLRLLASGQSAAFEAFESLLAIKRQEVAECLRKSHKADEQYKLIEANGATMEIDSIVRILADIRSLSNKKDDSGEKQNPD